MSFKTSPSLLSASSLNPVLSNPTDVEDVLDVSPPPQAPAPIKQEMDEYHGMPSVSQMIILYKYIFSPSI